MLFVQGKHGKEFLHFDINDFLSESIVFSAFAIYKNKQRNLFFDRWYSSIKLIAK